MCEASLFILMGEIQPLLYTLLLSPMCVYIYSIYNKAGVPVNTKAVIAVCFYRFSDFLYNGREEFNLISLVLN